jgi:hypothetical protein
MASPEDQELMAKISNLAGKINRHKAQQDGTTARKSYDTRLFLSSS